MFSFSEWINLSPQRSGLTGYEETKIEIKSGSANC